ncbi:MAG: hypothetical protein ACREN1_01800 [Candidatus Dormibacteria bacterium]
MANTSMESSAWMRKQLEGADPELLRELLQGVVEQLMGAEAQAVCRADLRPSVNECASGSISDPTPPPVSCPNGDLNVEAWEAGTPLDSAGHLTRLTTVEADICREYREFLKAGAAPTAASLTRSYSIAALYYGWKFPPSPAQVVADAGCVH